MSVETKPGAGTVTTLGGPVPAGQLGLTLPHEHLTLRGWDYRERNYFNSAYMELAKFSQAGGRTLVEVSSIGLTRDVCFFQRLGERAGVQVVMGTGFYKEGWLSPVERRMSVEEMTDVILKELLQGIGDTDLRAGIIGEVGVSRRITPAEERSLTAAARASAQTGAAISLHFDIGVPQAAYDHALDILAANGADLSHVAVGHLIARADNLELCQHLAGRGCFIEFDLFGQERSPLMAQMIATHPEVQASSIKGFVEWGLTPHILLSQNVHHVDLMTVNGGDGYIHLQKNVLPTIRSYGVTDAEITMMTVDNPRRLLTVEPRHG